MSLKTAFTRSRRGEKRIGSARNISIGALTIAAATVSGGAVSAGGVDTSTTVNIPGIGVNDVVQVTVQTPTAGILWDAYVSAVGTVTIRATNCTSGSLTTAATVAQVHAFFL